MDMVLPGFPSMAKKESLLIENWYPVLGKAGLPQPKTTFFKLPDFWPPFVCDGCINGWEDLGEVVKNFVWERLKKQVNKDFGEAPVFFKSSTFSNKHSLENLSSQTIDDIVMMYYMGMVYDAIPDIGFGVLAIRQFIEIEGEALLDGSVLPIGVERRLFVKNGQVTKVMHYWPQEAFKTDVSDYLAKLNAVETPSHVIELAGLAGAALTEEWPSITEWSVDFALDKYGKWWLIDIATAEKSWGREEGKEG
jgi:hypothetical protein